MKVCVCAGRRVWSGDGRHHGGAVIELAEGDAQELIALGVVEKVKAPAKKAKAPAKKAKAEGAE